ncbi:MAG: hypothetical protein AAFR84_00890 [Pseudomonadota bacterium]
MKRTSLYRHYDADGVLLYVGIALNHVSRLSQHMASASWFYEIARIEVEHFDSRLAAETAERIAIRDERPLHNKAHVDGKATLIEECADRISGAFEECPHEYRAHLLLVIWHLFGVSSPTSPTELADYVERRREEEAAKELGDEGSRA